MKYDSNNRNNKNSQNPQITMENLTQSYHEEYPFCRLICKLEGIKENQNKETLKIEKCDEIDGKFVKNQWIFKMNKIYDYNENLDEICENELVENQYFCNFFNGFKSNMILITNNSNSILNNEDNIHKICQKSINQIFSVKDNLPHTFGGKKFVTLSLFEISNDKITELIDFNNKNDNPPKELKIFDHIEETIIDGLVEIKINKPTDFYDIIKLITKKNISQKSRSYSKSNVPIYKHQVLTIKSYVTTRNFQYDEKYLDFKNPDLFNLTSKLNIIIFKTHEILTNNKLISNNKNYFINSSENYKFFNSLKTIQKIASNYTKTKPSKVNICSHFRSCKVSRIIKDTFLFNDKNLIISFLPNSIENVILLHDILNSIKERRMNVDVCENVNICNENEVSFNIENKENISHISNNIPSNNTSLYNLEQNLDKLQLNCKIETKDSFNKFKILKNTNKNIWLLLSKFEENLGNKELAFEYSQRGLR